MAELKVQLQGARLVFPDGKPICLVCRGEPAGARRVWFEEVHGTRLGTDDVSRGLGLAAGARALRERIAFDAPLCGRHRAAARWLSVGTALCGLATVGAMALGVALFGSPSTRRTSKSSPAEWAPMLLGLIPAIPGLFLWRKKDRGGLTCEVRRDGPTGLVLMWPDEGC
jgi:hypothetical protein